MAAPEDDVSRFLFGLYRDAGAIRVRRAQSVAFGEAQEAHTRRVVEAWVAATRPPGDPIAGLADVRPLRTRPPGPRAWLRAALSSVRHAR
ncbi:MAG TPA: hypothetical protein VNB64_00300 [Solirubrobacteraceae bacterium]|nr:hypothetical protein [Solirubrobacteraceae bacterium]